jgi:hypothetical protein
LKPRDGRQEFANDRGRQGYPNKEAHTETMVSALFGPPARMVREGDSEEVLAGRPAFRQGLTPRLTMRHCGQTTGL